MNDEFKRTGFQIRKGWYYYRAACLCCGLPPKGRSGNRKRIRLFMRQETRNILKQL